MLYPEFAYTIYMQVILFFISCITTFLFFWFTTNVILKIYGEKVNVIRRVIFVFFVGIVLNEFWIYGIYALGGFVELTPKTYALVTIPNPFFALLYCYVAIKILGMEKFRSIHLMRHVYIYWIVTKILLQIVGRVFFAQTEIFYNYLLDAISLCVCAIINIFIYFVINFILGYSGFFIRVVDSSKPKSKLVDLGVNFIQSTIIYCFVVITQEVIDCNITPYIYMEIVLIFFMIIMILLDYIFVITTETSNTVAYTRTLIGSIDRFDGIRHDFNNILQTYDGFITLGDVKGLKKYHEKVTNTTLMAEDELDLNRRISENPTLISLLIKKYEYSKLHDVAFRLTLLCSLDDFYIKDIDLCRVMGNLLDNAIEASSISKAKRVSLSIESKIDGSKLIVISNSTKDDINIHEINMSRVTTKNGHSGLGLTEVRKILSRYPQCSLQFLYYNMEFSVYIEILPIK